MKKIGLLLLVLLGSAMAECFLQETCPYDGEAAMKGQCKLSGLTTACEYSHQHIEEGRLVRHTFWVSCQ